jgi:predicted transcriptional regulator
MKKIKIRTLERVFKGVGNHYRIRILLLISKQPGITLDDIVGKIKANYQTIAEHVNRLKIAGLIIKKHQGKFVIHTLSPYGEKLVRIVKKFGD